MINFECFPLAARRLRDKPPASVLYAAMIAPQNNTCRANARPIVGKRKGTILERKC